MPTRAVNIHKESCEIYVGRPSSFGNPYKVGPDGTRAEVLLKYDSWVRSQPELIKRIKRELRGKTLGCSCLPNLCHASILAAIADEP